MRRGTRVLLAVLSLAAASQAARAASINLATGLDANNNLIASGGASDAHWIVQEQAGGTGAAQVVVPSSPDWWGLWVGNGPNSDWISRNANLINNGPAPYTFSTTFDLTGADLSQVSLSGAWAIDDAGTLNLNGHQIGSLAKDMFRALTPFTVPAGSPFLNQGLNTLSITIVSNDEFFEGARLEGTVAGITAVPEPPALVLSGVGTLATLGCCFCWRRRGGAPARTTSSSR